MFSQRINSSAGGRVVDEVIKKMEGTLKLRLSLCRTLSKEGTMGASPSRRPRFSNATPSQSVSEAIAVCRLVSERVINRTSPFNLMLAACCSAAELCSLRGVPQSVMAFTLCITAHVYLFFFNHRTLEAAHLSQFPKSRSTLYPPQRLVLTLNHEPPCNVAGTVTVSAGPTDYSPRSTRGRGN